MRGALLDMHAIAARSFSGQSAGPHGAEARAYLAQAGRCAGRRLKLSGLVIAESSGQSLVRRLAQERFTPEQFERRACAPARRGFRDLTTASAAV